MVKLWLVLLSSIGHSSYHNSTVSYHHAQLIPNQTSVKSDEPLIHVVNKTVLKRKRSSNAARGNARSKKPTPSHGEASFVNFLADPAAFVSHILAQTFSYSSERRPSPSQVRSSSAEDVYKDYYDALLGGQQQQEQDDNDREFYYNDDYIDDDFDSISQIEDTTSKLTPDVLVVETTTTRRLFSNGASPEPIYLFSLMLACFGLLQILLGKSYKSTDESDDDELLEADASKYEPPVLRSQTQNSYNCNQATNSKPPSGLLLALSALPIVNRLAPADHSSSTLNLCNQATAQQQQNPKRKVISANSLLLSRHQLHKMQNQRRRQATLLCTIDEEPLSV